jgi:hypothetical protein
LFGEITLKVKLEHYQAFDWLPVDRWNRYTVMGPALGYKIYCKFCDKYVIMNQVDEHVQKHQNQRRRQIAEEKKRARLERVEAIKLAREAKKLLNEMG